MIHRRLVSSSPNNTSYIQGNALSGGDGSLNHPWNSFSQAQTGSWSKLIVLPSPVIILGSIVLLHEQEIEGVDNELALVGSIDGSVNDGDVIVCNGDNRITRINVKKAYRSGINCVNSRNLIVEECNFRSTNTSYQFYYTDYDDFSPNLATNFTAFSAIEMYGGAPINSIQNANMNNGHTRITNCKFDQLVSAIALSCGNSQLTSTSDPNYYHRTYKIKHCHFTLISVSVINILTASNGRNDGVIENCRAVDNIYLQNQCFNYEQNRANNTYYPARGNSQFGINIVRDCYFNNNRVFGVSVDIRNNEIAINKNSRDSSSSSRNSSSSHSNSADNSRLIIEDNEFIDCGINGFTSSSPPPYIEQGSAQIQLTVQPTCSGKNFNLMARYNTIIDSTGLCPAITTYYFGGTIKLVADIHRNSIAGTSTGLDILNYATPGSPNAGNGEFTLSDNKFTNNDSVIIVITDHPYTNLTVKAEDNCFIDTGARNSPPISNVDASYYGGAVIYGGGTNLAAQNIGQGGTNLGNAIVDLGGGPLGSHGHNAFINTVGPDTWVDVGLTLHAEHDYFSAGPLAAGGGTVYFNDPLVNAPKECA